MDERVALALQRGQRGGLGRCRGGADDALLAAADASRQHCCPRPPRFLRARTQHRAAVRGAARSTAPLRSAHARLPWIKRCDRNVDSSLLKLYPTELHRRRRARRVGHAHIPETALAARAPIAQQFDSDTARAAARSEERDEISFAHAVRQVLEVERRREKKKKKNEQEKEKENSGANKTKR